MSKRFDDLAAACAKVGRGPTSIERTAGLRVALAPRLPSGATPAGDGLAAFDMDGMRQEARVGTAEELVAHIREYASVGVEHLTLAVVYPTGPQGIEALAPIVQAVHG